MEGYDAEPDISPVGSMASESRHLCVVAQMTITGKPEGGSCQIIVSESTLSSLLLQVNPDCSNGTGIW